MQSSSESQESLLSHAVSQLSSYICISDPLTCTTNNFPAAHSLISTELQTYTGTWGGTPLRNTGKLMWWNSMKVKWKTHTEWCKNYWKINYVVTIF